MKRKALFFALMAIPAMAFIPPVGSLCDKALEGRRSDKGLQIKLRHRVAISGNQIVSLDETLFSVDDNTYSFVRVNDEGVQFFSTVKARSYDFTNGKSIARQSQALLTYFTGSKPETFRRALLAEGFFTRDQLLQYRPGFSLDGDPKSWNLKENYLKHQSIFLHRTPAGPVIVVQGRDDGGIQKIIYFRKDYLGLARLEWRGQDRNVFWEIAGVRKAKAGGFFPTRSLLTLNDAIVVESDWLSVETVERKSIPKVLEGLKRVQSKGMMSAGTDAALKLLMTYR